ncbi:hypothetical protein Tco_1135358 [Tanacetum coccineum]
MARGVGVGMAVADGGDEGDGMMLMVVAVVATWGGSGGSRWWWGRSYAGDLKIMMESSTKENDQELKDGTIIYILVERRYPLSKELLQRMLDLGLEVEEESNGALQLQMVFGKDFSNPFMLDNLPKIVWLSTHLVVYNEELAIPEQMTTGKGTSNLLMAGSLPKTTKPT